METPRNPDSVGFGPGTNDRRYTYWRQSSFHQQSQEPKTPISIITNDTTKPMLSRTVSSIDMPPEIDYSFDYQNDSIFEDPKKKPLDLDSMLSISVLCSISLSRIYLSGFHSFLCLCVFVCVIAMQTEAIPIVNKFQLKEDLDSTFPKGVPWVRYHGFYKDLHINLVWPGKDSTLGVDSVGTISASLVTYAAIQAFQPDLIINAGTAGSLKVKGASISDVFLASDVAFHDRRIPIPVFDLYGVGLRQSFSTPNLLKELNLKVGKLSTGDSLDMSPQEEASIVANDASVKDMEGAAVAYVADLLKVPAIFVKAVTDIVDGEKPTSEEFLQNLAAVTAALDQAVTQVVDFINGKCLSEL